MWLVFSDLDGTLLDHDTYSFEAARPALARLKQSGFPLILTTSKTRAEVELWRRRLENRDPFITENGGAAFVPLGYFPLTPEGSVRRNSYDVIEFGDRYEALVETLQAAAAEALCPIRAFHSMTDQDVAESCGLPLAEAVLAKQREYDEAFEILDDGRAEKLLRFIDKRGKRWTRGGRFFHIMGSGDKAKAVQSLRAIFEQAHGKAVTVGLGDGLNDAGFLNVVDHPVLIRSPSAAELLTAVPRGRLTAQSGPAGWNQAILHLLG